MGSMPARDMIQFLPQMGILTQPRRSRFGLKMIISRSRSACPRPREVKPLAYGWFVTIPTDQGPHHAFLPGRPADPDPGTPVAGLHRRDRRVTAHPRPA